MNNSPVQQLLQKEMSRQEFLATLGLAAATVLGFSSIIKLLTGKSFEFPGQPVRHHSGYGSSPYGR